MQQCGKFFVHRIHAAMRISPMVDQVDHGREDSIEREIADLAPEGVTRIRKAADRLCLWKLCRKAHACSADPNFCVERFEVLVSDEVRMAVETLLEAKLHGCSCDDACAMASPGSIEMYRLWLANLHRSDSERPASQTCEAEGKDPCIANSAARA